MKPTRNLPDLLIALDDWMSKLDRCIVAFSGGVDSAVVAMAAFGKLQKRAIALTGIGAAVSQRDLADARTVAQQIGIQHVELPTHEIHDSQYQRNDARRCYFCKTELYLSIWRWIGSQEASAENITVLNGTNLDDLNDYRPGLVAADEHSVRSPLVELKIGKAQVRELAEHWKLPIATKPASPCLASRLAYGQEVTVERLRAIESAERELRDLGFTDVRVRWHDGGVARIELLPEELPRLMEDRLMEDRLMKRVAHRFRQFGFQHVTLDPEGLRSGNLNFHLPILQLPASLGPQSSTRQTDGFE